jgi:hypothetical protein
MRFISVFSTAAVVVLSSCAGHELVRADDMSATQHRLEAQRERKVADKEAGAVPAAPTTDPGSHDWNAERQREAERRHEHARQHAAAAEFLQQFEDRECRHIPAGSRAACPLLGPVVRIDDVPGGIRATFADPKRVPPVIAEMRCHYAYARSRNFDETIGCPLYVRGIEVRQAIDPRAIEIVSRDEKTSRLLRERGRQQAVFVRQAKR